jgi:23S rRNA-/tRNA-specific pseudouridylate synthase
VLVELANLFGSEKPLQVYTAFVQGRTWEDHFEVNAPLAPDVQSPGRMRVDRKQGKRAITRFTVRERFRGHSLVQCEPITNRTHQIRAHLSHRGFPVVSDVAYGGSPLLLSEMKPGYRLKPGAVERPLIRHVALHAEELRFQHPVTQEPVTIRSPQPKVFKVALKYLRKFAQPPLSS